MDFPFLITHGIWQQNGSAKVEEKRTIMTIIDFAEL